MKSRKENGQEMEQMEREQSIGSERPDGRINEKTSKPFQFPWQNKYDPADEPDSTPDQCRWNQKYFEILFDLIISVTSWLKRI